MKSLFPSMIAVVLLGSFGIGAAGARGPWMADQDNTWGWQMMTPEERAEHQNRMHGFKTYDECKTYVEQHRKEVEARAAEKGATLPPWRRGPYGCENMRARGFLK